MPAEVNLVDGGFGADPTGLNDNQAAVTAAINDLSGQGGGRLVWPVGVYRVDSQIDLVDRVEIEFRDAIIDFRSGTTESYLFRGIGTLGTAHSLLNNVAAGAHYVNLSTGGLFARGDYAFLISNLEWGATAGVGRDGEIVRVSDEIGGRVYFANPISGSYQTIHSARLMKLTPLRGVRLFGSAYVVGASAYGSGLQLGASVNTGSPTIAQTFLEVRHAVDLHVEGLHISDFHSQGCVGLNVLNGVFENIIVENMVADKSNGYGLVFGNASRDCSIQNNNLRMAGRHPIGHGNYSFAGDIGLAGITRGLTYRGNHVVGSGGQANAIDVHPSCEDVLISDNVITDSARQGILVRGRRAVIKGNVINTPTEYGIQYKNETAYSGHVVISGNTIASVRPRGTFLDCDFDGNGKMLLAGERVTQLSAVGNVLSHLKYETPSININEVTIQVTSGTFQTGTSQILGHVSGATVWRINSVLNLTDTFGIRVDGGTVGTMRGGVVTGNVIDMVNSPPEAVGIHTLNARAVAITGNEVHLPSNATGAGIRVENSVSVRAVENVLRVFGTNSSAVATEPAGTASNHTLTPNTTDSF